MLNKIPKFPRQKKGKICGETLVQKKKKLAATEATDYRWPFHAPEGLREERVTPAFFSFSNPCCWADVDHEIISILRLGRPARRRRYRRTTLGATASARPSVRSINLPAHTTSPRRPQLTIDSDPTSRDPYTRWLRRGWNYCPHDYMSFACLQRWVVLASVSTTRDAPPGLVQSPDQACSSSVQQQAGEFVLTAACDVECKKLPPTLLFSFPPLPMLLRFWVNQAFEIKISVKNH